MPSAPPGRGKPGALTATPKACLTCPPSAPRAPTPPWPCPGTAGPPRAPAHGLGGRMLLRDRGRAVAEEQHGPVMPTILSEHALSEHMLLHALTGSHTREDKPYRFIAPATRVHTEKLNDPENWKKEGKRSAQTLNARGCMIQRQLFRVREACHFTASTLTVCSLLISHTLSRTHVCQ